MTVLWASILMGVMAVLIGAGLGFVAKKFAVKTDPRVEEVAALLAGANCGGCGFPGCSGYAAAVVAGGAGPTLCGPGGPETAKRIGKVMGMEVGTAVPRVAVVQCRVGRDPEWLKYDYRGLPGCRNSNFLALGAGTCDWGCRGFLDCVHVCGFGAIQANPDPHKPPVVDLDKCTGCGMCVKACPKNIIVLLPKDKIPYVACRSLLKGKMARGDCAVACIACGLCAKKCESKAIQLVNNLPTFDYAKCTRCGKCVETCKTKCILWLAPPGVSAAVPAPAPPKAEPAVAGPAAPLAPAPAASEAPKPPIAPLAAAEPPKPEAAPAAPPPAAPSAPAAPGEPPKADGGPAPKA
jgi:electron transport complex protein RnfB